MMEEGRIPCKRLREEHGLKKRVDIGVVQFERWNRLKKEASSQELNALTHETFSQRLSGLLGASGHVSILISFRI